MANNYGLQINNDVVIKMASVAVLEVEGVANLVSKTTEFKDVFVKSSPAKAIRIKEHNNLVFLEVYIAVLSGYDIKKVAEEVQQNVKTKLQNMTGNSIDKVNVIVADVVFAESK